MDGDTSCKKYSSRRERDKNIPSQSPAGSGRRKKTTAVATKKPPASQPTINEETNTKRKSIRYK